MAARVPCWPPTGPSPAEATLREKAQTGSEPPDEKVLYHGVKGHRLMGPGRPGDRNLSALPARLLPSSNPRARGRGADIPGKLTEAPGCQLRVPEVRGSGPTPSSGEVLTFLSRFIPESWPLTSEQCPGSGSQQGRAPGDSLVHGSPGHPQTGGGSRQAEWGDKSEAREQGCEKGPVLVPSWTDPQPAVGHMGLGVSHPIRVLCRLGREASPAQRAPFSSAPASLSPSHPHLWASGRGFP